MWLIITGSGTLEVGQATPLDEALQDVVNEMRGQRPPHTGIVSQGSSTDLHQDEENAIAQVS